MVSSVKNDRFLVVSDAVNNIALASSGNTSSDKKNTTAGRKIDPNNEPSASVFLPGAISTKNAVLPPVSLASTSSSGSAAPVEVLPDVPAPVLASSLFGSSRLYDNGLLSEIAKRPDLFKKTIDILARRMFGDDAAAAKAFSGALLEKLPVVLNEIATGKLSINDLPNSLGSIGASLSVPEGVRASKYQLALGEALLALTQGAALASQTWPDTLDQPVMGLDKNGKLVRLPAFKSMGDRQVEALIGIATGLAGRWISEVNTGAYRPGTRGYDRRQMDASLFGGEDKGWDKQLGQAFGVGVLQHSVDLTVTTINNLVPESEIEAPKIYGQAFVYDRVLPSMDGQLGRTIFGGELYDRNLMEALSGRMELFRPAVEMMARNLYGDNEAAVDAFVATVMEIFPSFWEKTANREFSGRDIQGHFDRLLRDVDVPSDISAGEFKAAVQDAVTALIHGGALVAQSQPKDVGQPLVVRDAHGNFVRQTGLNTFGDAEIAAMIAGATGLAGRYVADMRAGTKEDVRSPLSPQHMAEIDRNMFATEDLGWDEQMLAAFGWADSKTASDVLTDFVGNHADGAAFESPKPPEAEKADDPVVSEESRKVSAEWRSKGTASTTYAADMASFEDKKFQFLEEAVEDVDRRFVGSGNIYALYKLSAEQRAALLHDLLKLKAEFEYWADDTRPASIDDDVDHDDVSRARKELDRRIEKLLVDPDTSAYLDKVMTDAKRAFLARPENADLRTRLENAYLNDIVGGKAIDRALAEGKSFEEALNDYARENAELMGTLDPSFIEKHGGAASATLSAIVYEHYASGNNTEILKNAFPEGANFDEAVLPTIEKMVDDFLEKSGGLYPDRKEARDALIRQVLTDTNRVTSAIRGGMSMEDAWADYQADVKGKLSNSPMYRDLYKAGITHMVQAVTMGMVITSTLVTDKSKWDGKRIATTIAMGSLVAGYLLEGTGKLMSKVGGRFAPFTDNRPITLQALLKQSKIGYFSNPNNTLFNPTALKTAGQALGVAAGIIFSAVSFIDAKKAFKEGDKPQGALLVTLGVNGALGSALGLSGAVLEAAVPYLTATFSNGAAWVATSGAVMAGAGMALAAVGLAVGIGLSVYMGFKSYNKYKKRVNGMRDRMETYTGIKIPFENSRSRDTYEQPPEIKRHGGPAKFDRTITVSAGPLPT